MTYSWHKQEKQGAFGQLVTIESNLSLDEIVDSTNEACQSIWENSNPPFYLLKVGDSVPEFDSDDTVVILHCARIQKYTLISQDVDLIKDIQRRLSSGKRSLATNRRYRRVANRLDQSQVLIFVDPYELKQILPINEQLKKLEKGEVVGIGVGINVNQDSRNCLSVSATVELSLPATGVFHALTATRSTEIPPICLEQFSAVQSISFDWNKLFTFAQKTFDATMGEGEFDKRMEMEALATDGDANLFDSFVSKVDGTIFVGYLHTQEPIEFDYVRCYKFTDQEVSTQVIEEYLESPACQKYPLELQEIEGARTWFRSKDVLRKLQFDYAIIESKDDFHYENATFGSQAIVQMDEWIVFCSRQTISKILGDGEDSKLSVGVDSLDRDLTALLQSNQHAAPFALRVFQQEHWKKFYDSDELNLLTERALEYSDEEDLDPKIVQYSAGELMQLCYSILYTRYGKHVAKATTNDRFFRLDLNVIRSNVSSK